VRGRFWTFLTLATLVLVAPAAGVLLALEHGSRALMLAAAIGMGVAAVLFLLAAFWPDRRVDWERIQTEQRLWESGPLGRSWLRVRQRLNRTWKI
jgi:uncharacterized membrane protein YhaH (DUF805 family)